MDNLIIIRLDGDLVVFDRDDVPFFYELEKTNQVVLNNGNKLIVYEVPNEEIARKIKSIIGDVFIENNNIVEKNINM